MILYTLNIRVRPNDAFYNNECYYIYRQIGFTIVLSSVRNIVRSITIPTK